MPHLCFVAQALFWGFKECLALRGLFVVGAITFG